MLLSSPAPSTDSSSLPISRRVLLGFQNPNLNFDLPSRFFLSQMAKNRNKKNAGIAPMDTGAEPVVKSNIPEAMDTSEIGASTVSSSSVHRKVKGVQMKRSKNMRKKKALAKAISRVEKASEDISKSESKKMRVKLAKTLYD